MNKHMLIHVPAALYQNILPCSNFRKSSLNRICRRSSAEFVVYFIKIAFVIRSLYYF